MYIYAFIVFLIFHFYWGNFLIEKSLNAHLFCFCCWFFRSIKWLIYPENVSVDIMGRQVYWRCSYCTTFVHMGLIHHFNGKIMLQSSHMSWRLEEHFAFLEHFQEAAFCTCTDVPHRPAMRKCTVQRYCLTST